MDMDNPDQESCCFDEHDTKCLSCVTRATVEALEPSTIWRCCCQHQILDQLCQKRVTTERELVEAAIGVMG